MITSPAFTVLPAVTEPVLPSIVTWLAPLPAVIVPVDPSTVTCLVGSVPSVIVSFKDILTAVPSTEVLMFPSPLRSITSPRGFFTD